LRNLKSRPLQKNPSVALLPFVHITYARMSRMLAKYINKSDGLPPRKVAIHIRDLKNDLGLQAPSVCCIPCEWNKVYIAQTNGSIKTTVKENNRHLRLGQSAKSDVAEPTVTFDHLIHFQDTRILLPNPAVWRYSRGRQFSKNFTQKHERWWSDCE
jgi:hypothetical protein